MIKTNLYRIVALFSLSTFLFGSTISPVSANPRNTSYTVNCYSPNTETIIVSISNAPKGTIKVGYFIEFIGVGGFINGIVNFPSANSAKARTTDTFIGEYSKAFSQTPWKVTASLYLGLSDKLQRLEPTTVNC